jgi:hypothetical protein
MRFSAAGDGERKRKSGAKCRAQRLRQSVYSVTRFLHTPFVVRSAACLALLSLQISPVAAQSSAAGTLLDALSITVQLDSTSVARGSMRFRVVRTGSDVELVASGIVVRRGLRVTAELRTDSSFVFRRYLAESRDSAGRVIDRVLVQSAGGRVTLERVSPVRRMVREYLAQRDLVVLDTAALTPFVAVAGLGARNGTLAFLDVRRGTLTTTQVTQGAPVELSVAEVIVSGTPMTFAGLSTTLTVWRDAKGRLLRAVWGGRTRILRDDPPT